MTEAEAQATIDKVRALLSQSADHHDEALGESQGESPTLYGVVHAILSLRDAVAACAELLVSAVEIDK